MERARHMPSNDEMLMHVTVTGKPVITALPRTIHGVFRGECKVKI